MPLRKGTVEQLKQGASEIALDIFEDVQKFFDDFIEENGVSIGSAPHSAFWDQVPGNVEQSREKFINGKTPGRRSRKILVKGDSANSNIIKALRGEGEFRGARRMPRNSPKFFSDDQIAELAAWIDGLTPVEDEFELAAAEFVDAPAPTSYRLVEFEDIQINARIVPDTYFLTVDGEVSSSNIDVWLVPLVYVQKPKYWAIEVVGCRQGGISLPVVTPYSVTISLAKVTGTKEIEVIGAQRTVKSEVPPV